MDISLYLITGFRWETICKTLPMNFKCTTSST